MLQNTTADRLRLPPVLNIIALAAFAGAMIGATIGLRWLSHTMTHYVLAVILGVAGIQLLFF